MDTQTYGYSDNLVNVLACFQRIHSNERMLLHCLFYLRRSQSMQRFHNQQ